MATTTKKTTTAKKATTTNAAAKKATTVKKTATAKKTSTAKKTTAAKKPAAKKTTVAAKKTTTAKTTAGTALKLTATEKKLVELYRDASTATKKEAMEVLKADKKPNDSLIEAVLANKDLKKVLTGMMKAGLKK